MFSARCGGGIQGAEAAISRGGKHAVCTPTRLMHYLFPTQFKTSEALSKKLREGQHVEDLCGAANVHKAKKEVAERRSVVHNPLLPCESSIFS